MEFIPLILIVALFWFMVIRPASRRQKQAKQLQESLQVGQRVMLSSGIFGTITSLADGRAHVAVADGVEFEVVRGAVAQVEEPEEAEEPPGYESPTTEL